MFRQPTPAASPAGAAQVLGRAAEQAAALLAAAGITLRRLDGTEVAATLARSANPDRLPLPSQRLAGPGQIITRRDGEDAR